MSNKMKIGVGAYTIGLNEDIMQRLSNMSECEYMIEDLEKIISKIIDLWQGIYEFGELISAEESMMMINTLHEAKKDYRFLTSLEITKNSVFEDKKDME